ncbi:hypothetical protein NFI96_009584 [Prochilodus magdalenae]|nr:hypothetical protein NFI96_009584 [Prochilodus magdalenae]
MAEILFSLLHPPGKIRLSIFLIARLCGGLAALVWALRVLYGHCMNGGRISALVIMLLLSDLLELVLSPYLVTKLLLDEPCWDSSWTCRIVTSLWSASLFYGLHLQQVVVLEAALSSRHPRCTAHAFFPACSVITSIIVFISFVLCEVFRATYLVLLCLPLLLMITLTSCIVTCRAPPQTSSTPCRTRKPSSAALVFATLTLILYGTFIIINVTIGLSWGLWVVYFSLLSLRVVIDPVVCVLVYRKDLRLQTAPTHTEHDAVIELSEIQSSNPDTAQEV